MRTDQTIRTTPLPVPLERVPFSTTQKKTVRGFFVVLNDKGLHMRPSTELVKCVNAYNSQVKLKYGDFVVNAKSLIGILTLGATTGSCIEIEAIGEDAEEVIKSIQKLAEKQFYIHY